MKDDEQEEEKKIELKKQEEKFQEQISALKSVDKKVTNVDDCMNDATEELRRTYKATTRITDTLSILNGDSKKLIKNYEKSMKSIEEMNTYLNDIVKNTETDLLGNQAHISIYGAIRWEAKNDTTYSLIIDLSNMGNRPCVNVTFKAFIFQTDTLDNQVGRCMILGPIKDEFLAPKANWTISDFNFKLKNNEGSKFFLLVNYEYEDIILKKKIVIEEGWVWQGFGLNGNLFNKNDYAKNVASNFRCNSQDLT